MTQVEELITRLRYLVDHLRGEDLPDTCQAMTDAAHSLASLQDRVARLEEALRDMRFIVRHSVERDKIRIREIADAALQATAQEISE